MSQKKMAVGFYSFWYHYGVKILSILVVLFPMVCILLEHLNVLIHFVLGMSALQKSSLTESGPAAFFSLILGRLLLFLKI